MSKKLFVLIAFIFAVLMLVVNQARPPVPVDETRYLTVAWEFWVRGQYILPTLNFEPYHHKPPMLFWLINAMWTVFGETHLWAARLVPYLAALGTLFMTYRLGRALWPDTREPAMIATLMMAATPFFMIYSGLIMFDTLLAVSVLSSIYALLRFYQTNNRLWFLALGLTVGAGILIKGPVALLHILPLALFFPMWQRPFAVSRHVWTQGMIIAVMFAAIIGLSWALPAAHLGGPDYERMIFWGQSAGRMVKSFDHGHPWWFYIALMPFLLLPWPFIPKLWRQVKPLSGLKHLRSCTWQSKMILAWIVPVFIAFSLISGKQVHYLIPLLPGLFLLIGHYVSSRKLCDPSCALPLYIAACAPLALALFIITGFEYANDLVGPRFIKSLSSQLAHDNEEILLLALLTAVGIGLAIRKRPQWFHTVRILVAILVANAMGVAALHVSIAPVFTTYYDLTPIAEQVQIRTAKGQPVAVANEWHGELGYVARQKTHFDEIFIGDAEAWFKTHPTGIILFRHNDAHEFAKTYEKTFSQVYRSPDKRYSILEIKK